MNMNKHMPQTLFLVIAGTDYEPDHILSCHSSMIGAQASLGKIMEDDNHSDSVSVLAIAPGPGGGVTVALWRASWESHVDEAGSPQRKWLQSF